MIFSLLENTVLSWGKDLVEAFYIGGEKYLPERGEVYIGGKFLWKNYSVSFEEEDSVNKKIQGQ